MRGSAVTSCPQSVCYAHSLYMPAQHHPAPITLQPYANCAAFIGDGTIVAFNVGADRRAYVVIAGKPLDYRWENSAGASFAKVAPDVPQSYRVVGLDGPEAHLDVTIEEARFNVHDVQPLRDDILLVCARSAYRGPQDFDLNGHVFDRQGHALRSFLLGDGIQTVQATSAGTIWMSFFDEGVFGNRGTRHPIGASGLVAWSGSGECLYEFMPPAGVEGMVDCYALNVESNNIAWCYYYTAFPLVRIRNLKADASWRVPIRGSSAFAISASHALFSGGYGQRALCTLLQMKDDGRVGLVHELELRMEDGTLLEHEGVVGRGDALWLRCGANIYRLTIGEALSSARR